MPLNRHRKVGTPKQTLTIPHAMTMANAIHHTTWNLGIARLPRRRKKNMKFTLTTYRAIMKKTMAEPRASEVRVLAYSSFLTLTDEKGMTLELYDSMCQQIRRQSKMKMNESQRRPGVIKSHRQTYSASHSPRREKRASPVVLVSTHWLRP